MARRDRVYMPMGAGGLLRYQEEEEMLTIKPEQVVLVVIGIIALELLLKFLG
ncbi:MAG: preprotein translocase subunit Sec61beta [Candidatus Aenigmatarchaeota archaeon]